MKLTIEWIIARSVHIALGIGSPAAHVRDSKVNGARTPLEIVHPEAVPALILVPPATLILHPVAASTITEQNTLSIVVDVHLVVAPPAQRLQWTPNKPLNK